MPSAVAQLTVASEPLARFNSMVSVTVVASSTTVAVVASIVIVGLSLILTVVVRLAATASTPTAPYGSPTVTVKFSVDSSVESRVIGMLMSADVEPAGIVTVAGDGTV